MSWQIEDSQTRSIGTENRPLVIAASEEAAGPFREIAGEIQLSYHLVVLDKSGDVVHQSDDQLRDKVEVLWCHGRFTGQWVTRAVANFHNIKWVHSDFVGVDSMPIDEFASREIILTNGGDNFARPMAEWTVLGMLSSAKEFFKFVRNSDNAIWDNSSQLRELRGAKVLLLGLGSVNSLVARMLIPFEMEVVGWSRKLREVLPLGVSRQVIGDQWMAEISDADYIVVGLPATLHTRGLIGSNVFEKLKPGTTVINLARGAIIDHQAMVEALDLGRFRYLLLDAFEQEPLPVEDPLWRRPNVTVVPHHSWSSQMVLANTVNRMKMLTKQYVSGEPFESIVDYRSGY